MPHPQVSLIDEQLVHLAKHFYLELRGIVLKKFSQGMRFHLSFKGVNLVLDFCALAKFMDEIKAIYFFLSSLSFLSDSCLVISLLF